MIMGLACAMMPNILPASAPYILAAKATVPSTMHYILPET